MELHGQESQAKTCDSYAFLAKGLVTKLPDTGYRNVVRSAGTVIETEQAADWKFESQSVWKLSVVLRGQIDSSSKVLERSGTLVSLNPNGTRLRHPADAWLHRRNRFLEEERLSPCTWSPTT